MSLVVMKEFRANTDENVEKIVLGEKLSDAALALEAEGDVLDQLTLLRRTVSVQVPDPTVRFNVTVSPAPAITAGCVALPATFLVKPGDKVILQAVPVDGYNFTGWFRGAVLVEADAIAEVAIVAPAAGEVADEILAVFEAV